MGKGNTKGFLFGGMNNKPINHRTLNDITVGWIGLFVQGNIREGDFHFGRDQGDPCPVWLLVVAACRVVNAAGPSAGVIGCRCLRRCPGGAFKILVTLTFCYVA